MAAPSAEEEGKSQLQCFVHLYSPGTSENVKQFTDKRWATFLRCCQDWQNVESDCKEKDFVYELHEDLPSAPPVTAGFHETCYKRFTDRAIVERAKTLLNMLNIV